jgi:hypothetical protein
MAELNQLTVAKQLLGILAADEDRLERIDKYLHGHHDDPYMPDRADEEYKLLAKRAVSNWIPLLIGTPAQAAVRRQLPPRQFDLTRSTRTAPPAFLVRTRCRSGSTGSIRGWMPTRRLSTGAPSVTAIRSR